MNIGAARDLTDAHSPAQGGKDGLCALHKAVAGLFRMMLRRLWVLGPLALVLYFPLRRLCRQWDVAFAAMLAAVPGAAPGQPAEEDEMSRRACAPIAPRTTRKRGAMPAMPRLAALGVVDEAPLGGVVDEAPLGGVVAEDEGEWRLEWRLAWRLVRSIACRVVPRRRAHIVRAVGLARARAGPSVLPCPTFRRWRGGKAGRGRAPILFRYQNNIIDPQPDCRPALHWRGFRRGRVRINPAAEINARGGPAA